MQKSNCKDYYKIILNKRMEKNKQQDKPKLEDLLKLKRQEQPLPDFWERFDRDLNQKMLKALVKQEPIFSRIKRTCRIYFYAWAPASCVAALTLIAIVHRAPVNISTLLASSTSLKSEPTLDVVLPERETFFKELNQSFATRPTAFVQNTLTAANQTGTHFAEEKLSNTYSNKVKYVVSSTTQIDNTFKGNPGRLF